MSIYSLFLFFFFWFLFSFNLLHLPKATLSMVFGSSGKKEDVWVCEFCSAKNPLIAKLPDACKRVWFLSPLKLCFILVVYVLVGCGCAFMRVCECACACLCVLVSSGGCECD